MPKTGKQFPNYYPARLCRLEVKRKTNLWKGNRDKTPHITKPQLHTAALCLTCKAGETLGVDSQGPGARKLNALQERSTN